MYSFNAMMKYLVRLFDQVAGVIIWVSVTAEVQSVGSPPSRCTLDDGSAIAVQSVRLHADDNKCHSDGKF